MTPSKEKTRPSKNGNLAGVIGTRPTMNKSNPDESGIAKGSSNEFHNQTHDHPDGAGNCSHCMPTGDPNHCSILSPACENHCCACHRHNSSHTQPADIHRYPMVKPIA
jgi:hypothetical protein